MDSEMPSFPHTEKTDILTPKIRTARPSETVVKLTREFVNLTNLSDWTGSTNMFVILTNGLVHFNEIICQSDWHRLVHFDGNIVQSDQQSQVHFDGTIGQYDLHTRVRIYRTIGQFD